MGRGFFAEETEITVEDVLRPVLVFGGAGVLAYVIALGFDRLLVRGGARRPGNPLWALLRRCRTPLQAVLFVALVRGFLGSTHLMNDSEHSTVQLWLTVITIGACAWLALRVISALAEAGTARYLGSAHDAARARRVQTQLTLIQRLVTAVVTVIAIAAMLLQFDAMKGVGASLLASAGLLGIVAGVAAQPTLGNLFAGLSIAFSDMVRIGDTVVVDGELGTVEEITVSYLVIRTWDERRITMPVSYFASKPFENWSRGDPRMTGAVFLHLDHTAPIAELRAKTEEAVRASDAWDGRGWSLEVTDTTPAAIEVRATMTASTTASIWTLRCEVREALITWLRDEQPYALPRVRTTREPEAPPPSPDAASPPPESRTTELRKPS